MATLAGRERGDGVGEGGGEGINDRQERIKRSLHIHYILESTFARILLFLELPFLQGVSIYRKNLFPLTFAYKRPK